MDVVPDAATSATGLCCSCAMNPTTEKMTKPANILVLEFTVHTINASLKQKQNHVTMCLYLFCAFLLNYYIILQAIADVAENSNSGSELYTILLEDHCY